jgi:hypothetical protein
MKDIDAIVEDPKEWQSVNKDNRSVIIIASEMTDEDDEKYSYTTTAGLVGKSVHVINSAENAMMDDNNILVVLISAAKEMLLRKQKKEANNEQKYN